MLDLQIITTMPPPFPGLPDEDSVQAVADLISRHRFGCPSACLPTHLREVLLADLERLLARLDRVGGPYAS